jgi:S-methylmethionine-dependent homocysteine/selenocysteine methylase
MLCDMLLSEFLSIKETLILDGAMGTALERSGVSIALPLWSATALRTAPFVVRNIHWFYLSAGADILTTNTFRTNIRTLRRAGLLEEWEELNLKAVEFAFEARDRYRETRPVLVAASIAPVEDCYSPDRTPHDVQLEVEHFAQAEFLARTGIDFFLIETMPTVREALAAARACRQTGKEFAVSFVCDASGSLLSGEPLEDAVFAVSQTGPAAILVNCISAKNAHVPLAILARHSLVPFGCYANVGAPTATGSDIRHDVTRNEFAESALHWKQLGARIIGGCCGTTPEHIKAVNHKLHPPPPSEITE